MNYGIGSIIRYSPFGGGERVVKVTEVESDIKNGRPGFAGVLISDSEFKDEHFLSSAVWGYDSQIIDIIKN